MADRAPLVVYYSLQSDYCYFLLDRLLNLAERGVNLDIRPVLGGVIRAPEFFENRSELEQAYFELDTQRTADFLGLPYAYPDPSPIAFKPDSLWIAEDQQPRNERLNRLFVGAWQAGRALDFLTTVGRLLWDGSVQGWDQGTHIQAALVDIGLDETAILRATPWDTAKQVLDHHAAAMLTAGHWGVPLMVFEGEAFYGQDRFDQVVWRMKEAGELP